MGYSLYWTDEQVEKVANRYGFKVAQGLENALNNKQNQVKWLNQPSELPRRFHNMFALENLKIAEISFNVQGKEFRAICVVIHDLDAIVYHTTVDKETGNQDRRLAIMRKNSEEIEESIRETLS
jgi:mRNA-degrading endonuclease HigB of HigAB toxin-antitoxin module